MATQPRSDEELVEVFGSRDESEAQVVRGLLESAGIDTLMMTDEAPQDILPGVGAVVLKVPASQAAEARQIIEEARTTGDREIASSGEEPPPAA